MIVYLPLTSKNTVAYNKVRIPKNNMLINILLFTAIGSILSLTGGFLLLSKKTLSEPLSLKLSSLAAGVLLATAFLDLFPESLETIGDGDIFVPALSGMVGFFLLERFFWFHHHHDTHHDTHHGVGPSSYFVIFGDSIHNFIDGVAIAAGFLVSVPLGISTAIAVAAHEIPQELADFSILLSQGFSRRKALYINVVSSLTALFGAVLTYFAADQIEPYLPIVIAFTAGMFIYVASSDLIPELHRSGEKGQPVSQVIAFIIGIVLVAGVSNVIGA